VVCYESGGGAGRGSSIRSAQSSLHALHKTEASLLNASLLLSGRTACSDLEEILVIQARGVGVLRPTGTFLLCAFPLQVLCLIHASIVCVCVSARLPGENVERYLPSLLQLAVWETASRVVNWPE